MVSLRKNKRGDITDILYILIVITIFGVLTLLAFNFSSQFTTRFSELAPGINTTQSSGGIDRALRANSEIEENFTGVIDGTFLFLMVGLVIAAIALATLVKVHPIFIPLFLIALIFIVIISAILSNIYQQAAESATLVAEADRLTFITYIMEFLPLFVGVFGIILMVVMYKTRSWAE